MLGWQDGAKSMALADREGHQRDEQAAQGSEP